MLEEGMLEFDKKRDEEIEFMKKHMEEEKVAEIAAAVKAAVQEKEEAMPSP